MKNNTHASFRAFAITAAVVTVAFGSVVLHSCRKNAQPVVSTPTATANTVSKTGVLPAGAITDVVNVIQLQTTTAGTQVAFSRYEPIFNVFDAGMIATLSAALKAQQPVKIAFNPANSELLQVAATNNDERRTFAARIINSSKASINADQLQDEEAINHFADMGVINTTEPGLTPVIPDMATAQLIFNYFSSQCCINPGPYNIDHCITFQYCADGCYARAHKMCYLMNNKYHYATQKVFSFALGSYSLSVQAGKWCNECINWWYHVAPLVTIQTTTGPKAYVFDPSMFDQPVPLATWLHAQANPACSSSPKVTNINIQPTSSYSPSSSSGTTFDTDPYYTNTNSTLVSYRYLHTCP